MPFVDPLTQKVYEILTKRNRPLRIAGFDADGMPYYNCKIKNEEGIIEYHTLNVLSGDKNWKKV